MKTSITLIAFVLLIQACSNDEKNFDASGNFESTEYVISAQSAGILQSFSIQEGDKLGAGTEIGFVDSTQLYLKKRQLLAQIEAVKNRKPNLGLQIAALKEQLETAKTEKARLEKLIAGNAATTKQLDDVNAQIQVLQKQLRAQESNLSLQINSLDKEAEALEIQLLQVEDQLEKSKIINPVKGTVLTKYAEQFEMAAPGKALYKIADLETMELKAYVSGNQLAQIKIGQKVTVRTDDGNGAYQATEGELFWISDKSEFTPKAIQTKDERANRVYAIKVRVKNDGRFKIGMYGEVQF
ncbi:HlyD family efflux transporter periplasmic adaptor subunit [bacterium]|nr:MAG: HlyD family efflux transporter periplasmic adaptor subunit [bacterium]